MTYKLKLINSKGFYWTLIPSCIILPILGIFFAVSFDVKAVIYFIFPVLVFAFIIAQTVFSKYELIELTKDKIRIANKTILFSDIDGYYIGDNVSISAFNLKLTNGTILKHTISTGIKYKRDYQDFKNQFKSHLCQVNPESKILAYQDIYLKQMNFLRPLLIASIVIVILIDIITVYSILTGSNFITWHVLFINLLLLWQIPLLMRKE